MVTLKKPRWLPFFCLSITLRLIHQQRFTWGNIAIIEENIQGDPPGKILAIVGNDFTSSTVCLILLRDRRLCKWAQKVKPSWSPKFQFNIRTFRLVWQKSSLKMEWRVMLRLHFSFYKNFCISNQEKVTGSESWDSSRFAISRNFQLGSIWGLGGHQNFQVLLKGLTRTHEVLWELNKATQDLWSFKSAFWALEGLLI